MADHHEIAALKASFNGAVGTAATLGALRDRVDALDPAADPDGAVLEELRRLAAAQAVASNALRGLLESMIARRQRHT